MSRSRYECSRADHCLVCGIRYYCPDMFDQGYCSSICEDKDTEEWA